MLELLERDGAVTFRVRVQPRSSKNEITGEYAGALKIRLTAAPVDGKANEECRRFLAKVFGISLSEVEIVLGSTSRDKTIRIRNVSADRISAALSTLS